MSERTDRMEGNPVRDAVAGRLAARLASTAAGIVAFAAATALAAQPELRLPFTPVPLTLQVLTVLLSGYALGARGAFASQALYLAAGAAGLPVFAGGGAGAWHLAGPTAGYLWAMPAAGWLVGAIAARTAASGRRSSLLRFSAAFAGAAVIHLGGAIGIGVWLAASGQPLAAAAGLGVAPFLLPDALKATLAGCLDAAVRKRA